MEARHQDGAQSPSSVVLLLGIAWCGLDPVPHRDPAGRLERQLERHPPDQLVVTLNLTDDLFLRSYKGALWQLGIPLPVE